MISRGLLAAAMATSGAMAGVAACSSTATNGALIRSVGGGSATGVVSTAFMRSANVSRPRHMIGEVILAAGSSRSVGFISLGDSSASLKPPAGSLPVEDILASAALWMQGYQIALDRDIQEIVSNNYEAYWD